MESISSFWDNWWYPVPKSTKSWPYKSPEVVKKGLFDVESAFGGENFNVDGSEWTDCKKTLMATKFVIRTAADLPSDIIVEKEVRVGIDGVLQASQPLGHLLRLPVQHVHVRHPLRLVQLRLLSMLPLWQEDDSQTWHVHVSQGGSAEYVVRALQFDVFMTSCRGFPDLTASHEHQALSDVSSHNDGSRGDLLFTLKLKAL